MSAKWIVIASLVAVGAAAWAEEKKAAEPAAKPGTVDLVEISGVTTQGDFAYVVGATDGEYLKMLATAVLPRDSWTIRDIGKAVKGERFEIPAQRKDKTDVGGLGAIAVLNDEVVVLSEHSRKLLDTRGVVYDYSAHPWTRALKQKQGDAAPTVGLEGLAIRRDAKKNRHIAVLWEGGSTESGTKPPLIGVHVSAPILARGDKGIKPTAVDCLYVDIAHAFDDDNLDIRAPGLVWHELPDGSWGFILLLSEATPVTSSSKHRKWLVPTGPTGKVTRKACPLRDLGVNQTIEVDINWEGLARTGDKLILVENNKDRKGQPETEREKTRLLTVEIPKDW